MGEVPAIPNENGTGGGNSKLKGGRGSDRYVYFSEFLNYLENINPSSYATIAQLNAGLALKLDLVGTSSSPMTGGIQYSPLNNNTTFLYSTSKSYYSGVSDNPDISLAANRGYIYYNKSSYGLELGGQNPSNFTKLQIYPNSLTATGDNTFSGILYSSSINYSNFTSYTLINKQFADNNYVSINNNTTMTGFVTLAGDPTNTYGAATKNYVDNLSYNTNWKHSVDASTTGALPSYTVSSDFQTLTGVVNGALPTQDTINLLVGNTLLVKNESGANKSNHGAFTVIQLGSLLASQPFILQRRADSSTATLLYGATYTILTGSVEVNRRYAVNIDPITLGTTQITFALIGGPGAYINGTYLSLTGNVFDINFSSFSTSQVTEGSNLYYTQARFDTAFSGKSTSNLSEGTNLYFTNARAISALTGQSNSIFTNGAGYLTANQTITLSGDISGSGTTSISTSIGSGKVTNTMLVGSITSSKLVGTDIATIGTITNGGLGTGAVIGGVTMTLGSDASYDIYYRNSSGVLTRLGNGTTGQYLGANTAGSPTWSAISVNPFSDASALVKNSSDTSKLAIFSAASITTGTTRTYTLPDINDTLETLTATQSPTNKSFTSSTNKIGGVTMNLGSDAVGDIYYGGTSNVLTRLASVAAGSYLRSGGVTTAPVWSTMTLPNTITANNILYSTATNVVSSSSGFTYDGTDLSIGASATHYIRVQGAAFIGGSSASGTSLYPLGQNMIFIGDQTNSNPNVFRFYCNTAGAYGMSIGNAPSTPTAKIDIQVAGTATASTSPMKFKRSGAVLLTAVEDGSFEVDANHLYHTIGSTRYQLDQQGVSNYSHTIFTPTTGGTITLVKNQYNIVNPVGALLALTVNLPSSPSNNDVVYIKFTQNVTTVTYANGTVVDGITTPTAGGLTVLVYDTGTTSWY